MKVPKTFHRNAKRRTSHHWSAFTLAELIVVVTILAVLATIGFMALSGYAQDAKDARSKSNVRSVYSAIAAESALTGNSPRYYVIHSSGASLSGGFVAFDTSLPPIALTGWDWNAPGTNYSAGNPDFVKLKLNPDKFKVTAQNGSAFGISWFSADAASFDSTAPSVWAADVTVSGSNGTPRITSYFQTVAVQPSGTAFVVGNYPVNSTGSVAGLVKDASSPSLTGALVDGAKPGTSVACLPATISGYSVPGIADGSSSLVSKPVTNGASDSVATCSAGTVTLSADTFSCSSGFLLVGWTCYANCAAGTQTVNAHAYSVSAFNHGTTVSPTITASVSNGSRIFQQTFSCTNGTVSTSGIESNTSNACDNGYSWNGSSCVANAWSSSAWSACSGETGTWSYGGWGSCSVSCGGGTQSRTSSCARGNNGSQSRTVQCLRYDGAALADSACLAAKPTLAQSCTQGTDAVCGAVAATSQSCNAQGCPQTGVCSGTPGACSVGSPYSDNGSTACSTTRAWSCTGVNGWSPAGCSYGNAACSASTTLTAMSCDGYGNCYPSLSCPVTFTKVWTVQCIGCAYHSWNNNHVLAKIQWWAGNSFTYLRGPEAVWGWGTAWDGQGGTNCTQDFHNYTPHY